MIACRIIIALTSMSVCLAYQISRPLSPAYYNCHQAPHWANVTIKTPITFNIFGSQVTRCQAGISQHSNAWQPLETVCATTKLYTKTGEEMRLIGIDYGCITVDAYSQDGCSPMNNFALQGGSVSQTCICRSELCNTVLIFDPTTMAPEVETEDKGIQLISAILGNVGEWVGLLG